MYSPYIHFTFCIHWSGISQPPRNVDQKACFFLSKKVVKHLTFATHLTRQLLQSIMFTGDSWCCHCTNVISLFLKSRNCFRDICFLYFITITILTSQSYEGIPLHNGVDTLVDSTKTYKCSLRNMFMSCLGFTDIDQFIFSNIKIPLFENTPNLYIFTLNCENSHPHDLLRM